MHRSSLVLVVLAACGPQAAPAAAPQPPPQPPPQPVAAPAWWCFKSVPFNAECVREEPHCNKDANEMRGYDAVKSVTPCEPVATVYCHQYADDPNANPLCYPSPEYCENGRRIMTPSGPQSACVQSNGGLVPPPPPMPKMASDGWWCFTSDPFNAECVPEQEHCSKDAAEMRGYSAVKFVSECGPVHTMYCHQLIGSSAEHALCYPSEAYCENGRKIMGEDSQTQCVRKDV